MKVKALELKGTALDWAVAEANGFKGWWAESPKEGLFVDYERTEPYSPSTEWAQGGPLVEREGLTLTHQKDRWSAQTDDDVFAYGPTPLLAAMRLFVLVKLGEEVEVPVVLQ